MVQRQPPGSEFIFPYDPKSARAALTRPTMAIKRLLRSPWRIALGAAKNTAEASTRKTSSARQSCVRRPKLTNWTGE